MTKVLKPEDGWLEFSPTAICRLSDGKSIAVLAGE